MFEWPHRPKTFVLVNGKRQFAPHYRRWANMKSRCYGNSYHAKWYRNRGIKVCEEWHNDFWTFFDWCIVSYEKGKSLDRIDNDGNYSPENCRWATQKQQMLNSRRWTKPKMKAVKVAFTASDKARIKKFGDPKTRSKKHCKLCGEFKKLNHFYKNKNNLDGVGAHCKPCNTVISRKYRVKKDERNYRLNK